MRLCRVVLLIPFLLQKLFCFIVSTFCTDYTNAFKMFCRIHQNKDFIIFIF